MGNVIILKGGKNQLPANDKCCPAFIFLCREKHCGKAMRPVFRIHFPKQPYINGCCDNCPLCKNKVFGCARTPAHCSWVTTNNGDIFVFPSCEGLCPVQFVALGWPVWARPFRILANSGHLWGWQVWENTKTTKSHCITTNYTFIYMYNGFSIKHSSCYISIVDIHWPQKNIRCA